MSIRSATYSDIPAMMALAAQAEEAAQWPRRAYEQLFDGSAPARTALVAENSPGEIVGFVVALSAGAEWEIENIVVSTAARRQGIGARLLSALLEHALVGEAKRVWLEVRESNRAARALYERAGFYESGRRAQYYANPVEDAVLYEFCPGNPAR